MPSSEQIELLATPWYDIPICLLRKMRSGYAETGVPSSELDFMLIRLYLILVLDNC